MDLIFCRNVIMYFTLERQERIINKLCECLAEGGLLVVSPAEASSVTNPHLVPVNHPGVVMFRKDSSAQAPKVFQPIFSFPDAEFTSDPFPGQFHYSWLEEQPPSVEPIPLPIFDLVDDKAQPVMDAVDSADVELELKPVRSRTDTLRRRTLCRSNSAIAARSSNERVPAIRDRDSIAEPGIRESGALG